MSDKELGKYAALSLLIDQGVLTAEVGIDEKRRLCSSEVTETGRVRFVTAWHTLSKEDYEFLMKRDGEEEGGEEGSGGDDDDVS